MCCQFTFLPMDLQENTQICIGIYIPCIFQHVRWRRMLNRCVITSIVVYFLDEVLKPHYYTLEENVKPLCNYCGLVSG